MKKLGIARIFLLGIAVCLCMAPFGVLRAARPHFNPPPYFAPEKSLTVQGVDLVYLDQGTGTPVLLIHGFSGNAYNWSAVFEPLSKQYRVIVPDLPGYGKSGCPAKIDHRLMLWYADFLADFMDQIGVKKAVVVGNSMGGSIAAWMAIRHPDKVDKLVLEDAAGLKGGKTDTLAALGALTAPPLLIPMLHMVFPTDPATEAKHPVSEQKRVELAELRYKSDMAPCSSKVMKWSMVSIGKDFAEPELGKISAPTLIIWGDNDDLLDPKTAEKFHAKIPGSQVQIIEGGVHTPMQWKPEAFIKVLEDFISQK
jgi:pimeloyl-ACP methyl ester carboxylesterase